MRHLRSLGLFASSLALCAVALAAQDGAKPAASPSAPPQPSVRPADKNDPDAPPPDAPFDPALPPGMTEPAAGWAAADMTPESIKRAQEFLVAAHAAYSSAAGVTDEITVEAIAGSQRNTQNVKLEMGKDLDLRYRDGSFEFTVVGNEMYMVIAGVPGKYVSTPLKGTASKTAGTLIKGFALGIPSVALRQLKPDDNYACTVLGLEAEPLKDIAIKGSRTTADGKFQMLLTGLRTQALIDADPVKHTITRAYYTIPLDESGKGFPLPVIMTFSPQLLAAAPEISFDKGARQHFASTLEMLQAPPEKTARKSAVGGPAKLAALGTSDGGTLDLATLKGKVIVLDFWATWCNPCRRGLPLLQQFAAEVKDNPQVAVFAVNVNERPLPPGTPEPSGYRESVLKTVTDFWTQNKFTFPTLVDWDATLFSAYGFSGIPATVVIAPDGSMAAVHNGFDPEMTSKLRAEVNKALAASAAGAAGTADAPKSGQ